MSTCAQYSIESNCYSCHSDTIYLEIFVVRNNISQLVKLYTVKFYQVKIYVSRHVHLQTSTDIFTWLLVCLQTVLHIPNIKVA